MPVRYALHASYINTIQLSTFCSCIKIHCFLCDHFLFCFVTVLFRRVIIHLIRGDSEDPLGDFLAINQELELFNPKLANMTQVVVVNKIDIPEVRAKLPALMGQLQKACNHTRIMGISAATRENVPELMKRVRKVIDKLPKQSDYELFTEEEQRVNFEEDANEEFDVLTDENFPGQFRVVGTKIEKIVAMMNWDYSESLQRFQRILEAQGISESLANLGAKQGDLVMIGTYYCNSVI